MVTIGDCWYPRQQGQQGQQVTHGWVRATLSRWVCIGQRSEPPPPAALPGGLCLPPSPRHAVSATMWRAPRAVSHTGSFHCRVRRGVWHTPRPRGRMPYAPTPPRATVVAENEITLVSHMCFSTRAILYRTMEVALGERGPRRPHSAPPRRTPRAPVAPPARPRGRAPRPRRPRCTAMHGRWSAGGARCTGAARAPGPRTRPCGALLDGAGRCRPGRWRAAGGAGRAAAHHRGAPPLRLAHFT